VDVRILVVEDQELIGKALRKGLTEEGFAVDWVTSVADGLHLALEHDYDTAILDLMLPDGSGFDFLKGFRERNKATPVLILSAKDSLKDKGQGFSLGADDYLTKPFQFEEVLMRVRALIRRKYQHLGQVLDAGPVRLDLAARTATVGDQALALTAMEFSVLEVFLLRRGHVLSREQIAEHLYPEESEQGSNVIDVFINKLRRKLEAAGAGSPIETVRGSGYVVR
jgi:DNA-binding response OmpR family regulator